MLLRQAPMFGREAWGRRLGGVIRGNVFSLASYHLPLTGLPCDFRRIVINNVG